MTFHRPALRLIGRPSAPLATDRRTEGRSTRATPTRILALVAGCLLVAQLFGSSSVDAARPTGAARAGAAPTAPEPAADASLSPGIHYEDAMAHAADKIAFTPGGRVTIGFRPRVGDTWDVAGHAPRTLPPGTASGRELLPKATAPVEAPAETPEPADPAPVDAPSPSASPLAEADGASATLPIETGTAGLDGTRLRRQVMGFLPYWEVSSATLDYELLSTIAYFSVGADKNGNLLKTNIDGSTTTGWSGWTSSRMTSIINAAHTKGTRVVLTLSVFAWTSGQASVQGALLGNATARLNLAKQAAAAVRARGADGINLDFEPIASGYADEFTAFVRTVRAELNKQAPGYQLTFDTTGSIGNYPIEDATAAGGADAIFIMGYDYRTAGSGYAGSIDPLAGPAYDLADTVRAFSARIAPSKIILGVPWYGRAWSTVSDAVNAKTQSGTKFGTSNSVVYDTAADYANQYGRRWDSRELSPWIAYRRENCSSTYGCVMTWRQVYYDDGVSLKLRYDMINRLGLRGAGIWALGYDGARTEMRQAIAEKFLNDKTVPVAGIRALAQTQTSESFAVAWTGTDESGVRDYDVQVSIDGGAWNSWLTDTTATSATYAGADGHGFAFRVSARDTHGNLSPWNVSHVFVSTPTLYSGGFGRVVASTLNVRSSPDTSAPIVTTAPAGTILSVTAGPVAADGYTWWKVSLPISEWAIVGAPRTDVWVASGNASTELVSAARPPNTTLVNLPSGTARPVGARFVGMAPVRLLDTRSGNGLTGPFASGAARTFQVAGRGGIPATAVAVTGTLTVVGQSSAGFASIGPSALAATRSSTVNVPSNDVRAAGVTVKVGSGGKLAAMWTGTGGSHANLVFDATGYFVPGASGATYVPLSPARVLDTRSGNGLSGTFATSVPRGFTVAGRGGVPAGAVAVTGNLTVVSPTSAGFLFVGPVATATPPGSTLNVPKGDIRAASTTVKLDANGRLGIVWKGLAGSRTHVVFDVTGYFVNSAAGKTYFPIETVRVLDSRSGNGLAGAFPRGTARTFQATGRGSIPVDAVAVTGGVTVVSPTVGGFLVMGPSGSALGTTSTINLPRGDIRANGATLRTGAGGRLAGIYQSEPGGSANVIFDATGYFR